MQQQTTVVYSTLQEQNTEIPVRALCMHNHHDHVRIQMQNLQQKSEVDKAQGLSVNEGNFVPIILTWTLSQRGWIEWIKLSPEEREIKVREEEIVCPNFFTLTLKPDMSKIRFSLVGHCKPIAFYRPYFLPGDLGIRQKI